MFEITGKTYLIDPQKLHKEISFCEVEMKKRPRVRGAMFDPVSLEITTLIIALISAAYAAATYHKKKSNNLERMTPAQKFEDILKSCMFSNSVIEYKLDRIENFDNFLNERHSPCKVTVCSLKGELCYTILLYANGKHYTIDIS